MQPEFNNLARLTRTKSILAVLAVASTALLPSPAMAQTSLVPDRIGTELALLPDAPVPAAGIVIATPISADPCPTPSESETGPAAEELARTPCLAPEPLYTPFLNSTAPAPLTPRQKAILAVRDFQDPGNLASIVYMAGLTIGTDSHTAYGPGWKGFAENAGYRTVRNATAEFVGTFLIPSLTHQDPRYHRMPDASVPRRILHAVSHTIIAEGDHGGRMPNYASLVGTPIRAEIANLYIPGVQCNLTGTSRRVLNAYATHPVDDLITEFLPDVARHVHVHTLFLQHLINNVAGDH